MSRILRPLPAALGLTAALGALAVAKTVTPAYQARTQALREASEAKRQSLHLSADAACKQDPTPEIHFEKAIEVHPGQTFHLRLPGTFHGTPGAVFRSDAVQVVSSRVEKGGLEIEGKVSPNALPGEVSLSLVRELCPRAEGVHAVQIVTKTTWEFAFPNGWKVAMACTPKLEEDGTNCQSTWTGKGGPQVMRAVLKPDGDQSFDVEYRLNAAQTAEMQKRMALMSKGPPPALMAQMQKAQAAFSECTKLVQAKAIACMQERTPMLQKASDAYAAAMKELSGPEGPPFIGCGTVRLDVSGSQVEAEGDGCGAEGPRLEHGTGTVHTVP
jgi:hypothetical protein